MSILLCISFCYLFCRYCLFFGRFYDVWLIWRLVFFLGWAFFWLLLSCSCAQRGSCQFYQERESINRQWQAPQTASPSCIDSLPCNSGTIDVPLLTLVLQWSLWQYDVHSVRTVCLYVARPYGVTSSENVLIVTVSVTHFTWSKQIWFASARSFYNWTRCAAILKRLSNLLVDLVLRVIDM